MNTREVQAALVALGYSLPKFGVDGSFGAETRAAMNDFQRDNDLPVTASPDGTTIRGLEVALAARSVRWSRVPPDWMPAAQMKRVIIHWTAGSHRALGLDRSQYHLLIEGYGKRVRGVPAISLKDGRGVKPG